MRIPFLALAAALSLAVPAMPLLAQPGGPGHERPAADQHVGSRPDNRPDNRPDGRAEQRRAAERQAIERRRASEHDHRRDYSRYDYNRPDPYYGNYRADRYYVAGPQYKARRLQGNERIYRGADNRYYCRRGDGTTGLIVGGLAGGALGNAIAPGDSKTIGTILGAGLGALLGQSVDRNRGNVTCR